MMKKIFPYLFAFSWIFKGLVLGGENLFVQLSENPLILTQLAGYLPPEEQFNLFNKVNKRLNNSYCQLLKFWEPAAYKTAQEKAGDVQEFEQEIPAILNNYGMFATFNERNPEGLLFNPAYFRCKSFFQGLRVEEDKMEAQEWYEKYSDQQEKYEVKQFPRNSRVGFSIVIKDPELKFLPLSDVKKFLQKIRKTYKIGLEFRLKNTLITDLNPTLFELYKELVRTCPNLSRVNLYFINNALQQLPYKLIQKLMDFWGKIYPSTDKRLINLYLNNNKLTELPFSSFTGNFQICFHLKGNPLKFFMDMADKRELNFTPEAEIMSGENFGKTAEDLPRILGYENPQISAVNPPANPTYRIFSNICYEPNKPRIYYELEEFQSKLSTIEISLHEYLS